MPEGSSAPSRQRNRIAILVCAFEGDGAAESYAARTRQVLRAALGAVDPREQVRSLAWDESAAAQIGHNQPRFPETPEEAQMLCESLAADVVVCGRVEALRPCVFLRFYSDPENDYISNREFLLPFELYRGEHEDLLGGILACECADLFETVLAKRGKGRFAGLQPANESLKRQISKLPDDLSAISKGRAWGAFANSLNRIAREGRPSEVARPLEPVASRRAAEGYERALAYMPFDEAPLDWGALQNNRANLLKHVYLFTRRDKLADLVPLRRDSMRGWSRDRSPYKWAIANMNLGSDFGCLWVMTGRVDYFELFVEAYEAALSVFSREGTPHHWRRLRKTLAKSYKDEGDSRVKAGDYAAALERFRAASDYAERDRDPRLWRYLQWNLGRAIHEVWLVGRRADAEPLIEAAASYRAALDEWDPGSKSAEKLMVEIYLGDLLADIGGFDGDKEALGDAASAYRGALALCVGDERRAEIASKLGGVLGRIGQLAGDTEAYADSIELLSEALKLCSKESRPLEWAETQARIGAVYRAWAEKTRNLGGLNKARAAFASALPVFRSLKRDKLVAAVENDLCEIERLAAKLRESSTDEGALH